MDEANGKLADATLSGADEAVASQEDAQIRKRRWRRRVTWTAVLVVLLAAALVLPPLINIGNYKRQITALMSRSMGRPVRLSGVELRLLPMPGFVLRDLSVAEDPQFGAEPILSARTVVASIRVLSLWRGRVEISRVSVDEASLNLVRSADGRWNLDSLIMGGVMGAQPAPAGSGQAGRNRAASVHFPYLEATDSRVNFKNGAEKTPFSLLETDLSLWQDAPGQWRVRLRGQPMRTDIPMSLADTGEVRLEASLHAAAQLRDMPLKLDMEWRNAQLGQLSRLLTGSDAGWRGDLTLDVSVQGTPDSAQTRARLRATGVRREEFAPVTPLDFDANCDFRYQHSLNAAHDVNCNTAIGDGQLHLKADLPGKAGPPEAMLEVKDLPLQAGLDLLRTVRGGFAPGIQAKGAANGSLTYKEAVVVAEPKKPGRRKAAALPEVASNLQGALTVDGAEFSGGELKEAVPLPPIKLTPTLVHDGAVADAAGRSGLTARFSLPLAATANPEKTDGAAAQATAVQISLTGQGYEAALAGTAGIERLRELAYALGWPHVDAADGFSAGTADFSLTAQGPWIAKGNASGALQLPALQSGSGSGSLSGSLTLHHAEWRAGYLARPVELAQGTATFGGGHVDFGGEFTYGHGKDAAKDLVGGTIAVHATRDCVAGLADDEAGGDCLPQVQLQFGALDAAALEAALLGAPEEKSLFSPLMDRMRSPDRPKWPAVALGVDADSLTLGPVTLQKPEAEIRFLRDAVAVKHWKAGLLGGTAEGTGSFAWTDGKPRYGFDGSFTHVSAVALGTLVGGAWTGGPVSGTGSLQVSGRNAADLAASAAGTLHFDWQHGGGLVAAGLAAAATSFDDWSGTAAIQAGKVVLGENTLLARRKSSSVAGFVPWGGPAEFAVAPEDGKPAAVSAPKQAVR